jgi:hypothetical protein
MFVIIPFQLDRTVPVEMNYVNIRRNCAQCLAVNRAPLRRIHHGMVDPTCQERSNTPRRTVRTFVDKPQVSRVSLDCFPVEQARWRPR